MSNETAPTNVDSGGATPNNYHRDSQRGGRRNNRRGNFRNNLAGRGYFSSSRFEGREPSMKGHIYDWTGERNPDQYIKTTKEVINYVGRTYTRYTGEFMQAVRDLELDDPPEPERPAAADPVDFEIWKYEMKDHRIKVQEYANFRAGLYNLVFGQCSEALQDKLRLHVDFSNAYQDGIALLTIIKVLTFSFEQHRKMADALSEIKESFYSFKQGRNMSLQRYYELFLNHVEVMDEVGVSIADDSLVNAIAAANQHEEPTDEDKDAAREQALAVRFIRGTNAHHASYLRHLRNSYLDGYDVYPSTLHDAYNVLQRREPESSGAVVENDGVAFATNGQQGRNRVTCFNCGETGHYANQCPNPGTNASQQDGNTSQQGKVNVAAGCPSCNEIGFSFSQISKSPIPKEWILLDSQSTIDLFCNAKLLSNIRRSQTKMNVSCNAGVQSTNLIGDLAGYGTVWYDPRAIGNILSLKNVRSKYKVTYISDDTGDRPRFMVVKPNGRVFYFVESDSGLHYLDSERSATVLVNTIMDKKSNYTNEDYQNALRAREIQIKIGRPSTKDFIQIVTSNQLRNCPITKADIIAAEDIFGPEVGSLKGKTTRRRPHKVRQIIEHLPAEVMARYRNVTLCVDIMFVNEIPMLVTLSRKVKFATVEAIPNRASSSVMKGIKAVVQVYHRAGFNVNVALMDGEFTKLRGALADIGIALNETARNEHVGDIERFIRTLKERMRSIYTTLPFECIPPRLVIEMAKYCVYWLNAFPCNNGISETISPRTIITGQNVDYNRHCKFQFGEYVQTHEEHDNSMRPRTIGALALRPTGNAQGSFYFYSLSTGRVITRANATRLPMPDDVIERVNEIGRQQKANSGMTFVNGRNEVIDVIDPMGDGHEDETYINEDAVESDDELVYDDEIDDEITDYDQGDDNDAIMPELDEEVESAGVQDEEAEIAGVHDEDVDVEADINENDIEIPGVDDEIAGEMQEEEIPGGDVVDDVVNNDIGNVENNVVVQPVAAGNEYAAEEHGDASIDNETDVVTEMDERYGPRTSQYNLRPRQPRDYSHLFAEVGEPLSTPQMNMKQGLQMFGEEGVDAVRKEMKQIHDRKVMKAKCATEMTDEQRKDALAYLMFLKRKRCGKVKGRGCADGRKQRIYTRKEDASSPTVAIESVFLTAVMDAREGRDVAVLDVPGAFMQADMDELVHVRFTGKMVDLLLEIDREMYEPYVVIEKGMKVMYVELLKALYGTLRAARLFWEKLSSKLHEWGFCTNPYDSCVANKMVNGKQLTVVWHVDDLKVSHVDVDVVDEFVDQMEKEFGKETPINKVRGKIHDYLGMVLDYTKEGELSVTMIDYIKMILRDIPDDMKGIAATPATNHLFQINENPVYLTEERSNLFVHFVMQLLYLSQRARPDIRTAISFLCGRLKNPDEDDYKKLSRVMKYLQGTIDLPLIIKADQTGVIRWWVNASYAVHSDMKGHTGGTMSMGSGMIYSTSTKQKLVCRSSTESEVVGLHDVLPQALWTANFLREQSVPICETVIYQDNLSSILLEKNGRSSSTKRTRHMDIRYFFIKDRVSTGDVTIEHCPTKYMLADYFTKPLQGALFYHMRDQIMNIDPSDKYHSSHRSVLRKGNIKLDSSFTGVKVDVEPADASSENTPDGKGAAGTSGNKDVHSLSFAND